jgi:hypothetical protein
MSLFTLDDTAKGSLLLFPQKNIKLKHKISKLSNGTQLCHIKKLFSNYECRQIINQAKTFGFTHVNSYTKDKRDSDRLVIFDELLSNLIWDRTKHIIQHLGSVEAIGFLSKGIWKPERINECFRVCQYKAPSIGFTEHFDAPYCFSFNVKSIFSIVIYLNVNYKDGETVLYDQENQIDIPGLTTKEEISLHGGLKNYKKITITPSIGSAIIFNHNILHSSNEITYGTKIIIRSDIVYKKVRVERNIFDIKEYDKCVDLFMSAQQLELTQKNVKKSSEYYERALSIRKSVSSNKQPSGIFIKDTWTHIFEFLNLFDLYVIKNTCKILNAYVQINKMNKYIGVTQYTSNKCIGKNKMYNHEFIPDSAIYCYGSEYQFTYNDTKYFKNNIIGCLRVITMYTLYKYVGGYSNTCIVNYDPERKMIIKCSLEWLLISVFYELPCYGMMFIAPTYSSDIAINKYNKDKEPYEIENLFDNCVDEKFLNNGQNKIGYTKNTHSVGDITQYICRCGIGDHKKRIGEHYFTNEKNKNRLVFDFSKNKINFNQCECIFKKRPRNKYVPLSCWKVLLDDVKLTPFNHASCQCDGDTIDVMDYNIVRTERFTLDKMHVQIYEYNNSIIEIKVTYRSVSAM